MSYGLIQTETMSEIADAIRARGGSEDTYLPSEMAPAIKALDKEFEGVYFVDHDGTRLHSYTWDEIAELEELPELPSWENEYTEMTCTGWNWSLEDIQSHPTEGVLYIGSVYYPTDENTHLIVHVIRGMEVKIRLKGVTEDAAVYVDWGDGSYTNLTMGTDSYYCYHSYSEDGDADYEITIQATAGSYVLNGSANYGALYQGAVDGSSIYRSRRAQLTRIYIGPSCTEIADYAFYHCTSLVEATIPNTVESIGAYAFYGCKALETITLSAVSALEDYAFYGCAKMTGAYLPNTITSFGAYVFAYNYNIEEITVPGALTSVGQYCFSNCTRLSDLVFSEGLTDIGDYAFNSCNKISRIGLSEGVSSIGAYAFNSCNCLTDFTLPSTVSSIGDHAFYDCYSVPELVIPDGVAGIGDYTFRLCGAMSNVELPVGLSSIGAYAFDNCTALEEINIPEGVETIGEYAFNKCFVMRGITFPSTLLSVGTYSFYGCYNLTSLILPENVTEIGDYAFYNCTNIEEISFPQSLESIGVRAFGYLYHIRSLTLPEGLIEIGSYAFVACQGLAEVYLPESLESIGTYAFYQCYTLVKVDGLYKQAGVTTANEFNGCYCLTLLTNVREVNSSVNFSYSVLNYESIINLFNGLSEENTGTVTLSEESYALLDEDDLAIATDKGWTVAYS